MDDQQRLEAATHQVARLKGFYIHAAIFVLVMAGLTGLNLWLGAPYWVAWVFLGWGLGLAGHALAVFGHRLGFVSGWEDRKIKQLMDQKPKP